MITFAGRIEAYYYILLCHVYEYHTNILCIETGVCRVRGVGNWARPWNQIGKKDHQIY